MDMASVILLKEIAYKGVRQKSTIICTILVIFKASLSFLIADIQASQGHVEI